VARGTPLGILTVLWHALSFHDFLDRLEHMLEARLMPRFPDELLAALVLSATPTSGSATFDFDGVPIACWKTGASGQPYLSACPDTVPEPDVQLAVATDLAVRHCAPDEPLTDCAGTIEALPADAHGYLWIE
jgi:hypothetical protein